MKYRRRAGGVDSPSGSDKRLRSRLLEEVAGSSGRFHRSADEGELRRTSTPPESPQAKRGPKYLIWVVVVVLLAFSIVLASVAVRLLIHLYGRGTQVSLAAATSQHPTTTMRAEPDRPRWGLVTQGRRPGFAADATRADAGWDHEVVTPPPVASAPPLDESSAPKAKPVTGDSAGPAPAESSLQPEVFRVAPF